MAFVRTYKELKVYQRAYALSLLVHKASLEWPKIEQFGGIADQYRRCSKSVCANLVEGFGKQAYALEFNRFMMIAAGSANECLLWTDFAKDLGYIEKEKAQGWMEEWEETRKMLYGLLKQD